MTNDIANAVSAAPQVADTCQAAASLALDAAWWFIYFSIIAAILQTLVPIILQFTRKGGAAPAAVGDQGWLDSLKGVLQALAGLPGWVAIFLAGLALLWMAQDSKCAPSPAKPVAGAAHKQTQGNQQAAQNATATNAASH